MLISSREHLHRREIFSFRRSGVGIIARDHSLARYFEGEGPDGDPLPLSLPPVRILATGTSTPTTPVRSLSSTNDSSIYDGVSLGVHNEGIDVNGENLGVLFHHGREKVQCADDGLAVERLL